MFLIAEPKSIEDFFKDVGFIPPKGYTLDYFITPRADSDADGGVEPEQYEGFEPKVNDSQDRGGGTVTYRRKDMSKLHADSYSMHKPFDMPSELPSYTSVPDPSKEFNGQNPAAGAQFRECGRGTGEFTMLLAESTRSMHKGSRFHFKLTARGIN